MKPLILIAGGSGSGKGKVARETQRILNDHDKRFEIIEIDNWYRENPGDKFDIDRDSPEAIEWFELIPNIKNGLDGYLIKSPIYSYASQTYVDYKHINMEYKDGIILEGLHALDDQIISRFPNALKLYVDADEVICFTRRMFIRNRPLDESDDDIKRYFNQVRPAYQQYILPKRDRADYVIRNNYLNPDNLKDTNLDSIVTLIDTILINSELI